MMRYVNSKLMALLFAILIFPFSFSCSDSDETPPDPPELEVVDYVTGAGLTAAGSPIATVWRAGVPTPLLASYPDAVVYSSAGLAIDVVGTDVYVCGIIATSKGSFAVYWKNGTPTVLGQGVGQANDIAVSGSDVYVTGFISEPNGSGYSYGVVWKNGQITYLTEGDVYSSASVIGIVGSDIYVGGNIHEAGKTYAAYWKNGQPELLTSGNDISSYVADLITSQGKVYTAGLNGDDLTAGYWKDTELVHLGDGSVVANVLNAYNDGSDIYFAGARKNGDLVDIIIWKNNSIVSTIPVEAHNVEVGGLQVRENSILVVGSIIHEDNSTITAEAATWTNGEVTVLDRGSDDSNVLFASGVDYGN